MVVEASVGAKRGSNRKTKIFVGNVHKNTEVDELKGLFAAYGSVVETDILTNYAFVVSDMHGMIVLIIIFPCTYVSYVKCLREI